ncbi:MAG: PqiC family protein [Gammaproteobacteria bacterium]
MKTVSTALLAASLVLGGCATSKPTTFYLLQPIATIPATATPVSTSTPVALGVGPIELPHYTDRPEIVTRGDGNQLDVAEFSQWGEPLDDNVTRVLAENLSMLLPTQRAEVFPWKRAAQIDYQVTVEVSRFDGTLGGDAVLAARWQVRDDRTGKEVVARKSRFTFPSVTADHAGVVAAMNRTLDALSTDIDKALESLSR